MSAKVFAPPDYWSIFSCVLVIFQLLGVMPVSVIKTKEKNLDKLEVRFSRVGFAIAIVFLVLSSVHTVWAPTMLITLEKSVVAAVMNPGRADQNLTNSLRKTYFNNKLGVVVKVLHPLLVSLTTLSARLLSVFMLAKSMPVLFKATAQVDKILSLPSNFYLANFGWLTALAILSLIFHLPVVFFHLWEVHEFQTFWGNIWEGFSMFNIITSFALELEFVLFCLVTRSRFKYINDLLTTFVSEDFLYDTKKEKRVKKVLFKWKGYARPRNGKLFSRKIEAKDELFTLFSRMDAINGGRFNEISPKASLIDVFRMKKMKELESTTLFKSLRTAHILLFDVLEQVNKVYQVHLLVSISSAVTEILFNFYFTIFGFISSMVHIPKRIQNGELYLITVWSVYYCLRFMMIVNVAHLTASTSKEALKIISKIDLANFELPTRQEIKMLSNHLSKRDFEFSACGLFNLNPSLISTSFSTGITYLVIMAQFH